jgi:hypothetical protein
MASTISAGTTAGTALNFIADTTGNLAFQTNGNVTAMTIDTSQNVTYANGVTFSGVIAGNGSGITTINASNVSSGTVATARLATSGTANSTTYLRGDQTWSSVPTPTAISTTNFTIQQVGSALVFQYNGANVAVMDSGGNLTSAGAFTAGGSV